ncbi:DUF4276 family protein [Fodinisporobacter ferrooxydans]|uniref:DUF4276 family protein n=1 Tax=Fodinisporobacter ferrooxydans TaxID=2901836 RepID=A0ABY4CQH8_9BACL|nr:DUF4276 family protein [Alicyclobacillaceae bacterium MYW30-H2]
MKTIRYFCTGGYTETAGIVSFLHKINPNIIWKRDFPSVDKPGPKITTVQPSRIHRGVTGQRLVHEMLDRLKNPAFKLKDSYDGILLIDDADCRFSTVEDFHSWVSGLAKEVQCVVGWDVPFYALLASPEVEAWFLSDWTNSFEEQYPGTFAFQLKRKFITSFGSYPWTNIESFGGHHVNGSCSTKLSAKIEEVFENPLFMKQFINVMKECNTKLEYSKRVHGAVMLQHIDPQKVDRNCRKFFSVAFRQLSTL